MAVFIQNSLSRKKEEFVPAAAAEVKMYTCGVTVYDDCHVGHARSLFIFDFIKKYLEYRGYGVKMVRNITDVDDKIINRAKEAGAGFEEVRAKYIENYYRDLKDLQIDRADFEPMATENVFYMVDHIKQLIEKASAYEVDGDVYFSVRTFADYGRLSGQSLDEMRTAVRIEKDEKKRDPLDFALWKRSKEGEPSWKSPWGTGRPGWHIECSTMSMRFLRTKTLDIHAGGRDLIFPHHENEIAQAEALTGVPFAKYWIHHGLLTIEGRKMSKSLGNFVTIQDALKEYRPNTLKMFFLTAHYGSAMDFTAAGLQRAAKACEKIEEFLAKAGEGGPGGPEAADNTVGEKIKNFEAAMDDDFNTAKALAVLFDLLNIGNKYLALPHASREVASVACALRKLSSVLGLNFKASEKTRDTSSAERIKIVDSLTGGIDAKEVEKLLMERREARKNKDFKRSDRIRDDLKKMGIVVEDKEKSG
ncbi:MAG TPA: cysteine--tRNA ligase [Candidatus Omnitrophica bacterium]|nr:cysteine--tRNA ligase [Candidatus Omnitrophota bacterium]